MADPIARIAKIMRRALGTVNGPRWDDPRGAEFSTRSWQGLPEAETRWDAQFLSPLTTLTGFVRIIGQFALQNWGAVASCMAYRYFRRALRRTRSRFLGDLHLRLDSYLRLHVAR